MGQGQGQGLSGKTFSCAFKASAEISEWRRLAPPKGADGGNGTVGMGLWEGWRLALCGRRRGPLCSPLLRQIPAADWTGQGSCASSLGSLAHLMGERSGKSGVAHSVLLHERMNEEAGEGRKPHMWAHMPLTAHVALSCLQI